MSIKLDRLFLGRKSKGVILVPPNAISVGLRGDFTFPSSAFYVHLTGAACLSEYGAMSNTDQTCEPYCPDMQGLPGI